VTPRPWRRSGHSVSLARKDSLATASVTTQTAEHRPGDRCPGNISVPANKVAREIFLQHAPVPFVPGQSAFVVPGLDVRGRKTWLIDIGTKRSGRRRASGRDGSPATRRLNRLLPGRVGTIRLDFCTGGQTVSFRAGVEHGRPSASNPGSPGKGAARASCNVETNARPRYQWIATRGEVRRFDHRYGGCA
jgi:hypothetical protein